MGSDAQAVLYRPEPWERDDTFGGEGDPDARPCLFLARGLKPEEPQRVELPQVVVLSRARVFDLAADAYGIGCSLRGLGLDPQVAMLDRMRADLEACLADQALP